MDFDYYTLLKEYENIEERDYKKIYISGMGGSGIIGDFVKVYEKKKLVIVKKDYFPEEYIDDSFLVILISYSGDTEETVNQYNILKDMVNKDNIVVISKGGLLGELSKRDNINFIKVQNIYPQTRYAFPVLFGIVLSIINKKSYYKLLDLLKDYKNRLRDLSFLSDKIINPVIIFTDYNHYPVANYFKMKLNEDSKLFAKTSTLSESNHHELDSYNKKLPFDFLFLRFSYYKKIEERYRFVKNLLEEYGNNVYEADLRYNDFLEELVLGSLSSSSLTLSLAKKFNVDPYNPLIIYKLKEYMKKVG